MNIPADGKYKQLLLSQYKVSSDFQIEEIGRELTHVSDEDKKDRN